MNNDLRPINTIPNFKRFCMTIGELPTSYLETMTYYEMLVWFTEYMKNTIIPTINNNGLAIQELQDKYIELKSYVDNYFTNLDVQEEINNKLDAMAQSGQLTDIIAQYLGLAGVLSFNTIADMKQATNLVNGSTCRTLGFHTINDLGGSFYKIRNIINNDIVDEMTIISLSNESLIAELISSEELNVKQFGAIGNGVTDDTLAIQTAINYVENKELLMLSFPVGFYKISEPLVISKAIKLKGYISTLYNTNNDVKSVSLFWNGSSNSNMLEISSNDVNVNGLNVENIGFNGNNIDVVGINLTKAKYSRIVNCSFTNIKGCIYLSDNSYHNIIEKCFFRVFTDYGIKIDKTNTPSNSNIINDNIFTLSENNYGITINDANAIIITNNMIEGSGSNLHPIYIYGGNNTSGIIITGNRIETITNLNNNEIPSFLITIEEISNGYSPNNISVYNNGLYPQITKGNSTIINNYYLINNGSFGLNYTNREHYNLVKNSILTLNDSNIPYYWKTNSTHITFTHNVKTSINIQEETTKYPNIYQFVDVRKYRGKKLCFSYKIKCENATTTPTINADLYKGGTQTITNKGTLIGSAYLNKKVYDNNYLIVNAYLYITDDADDLYLNINFNGNGSSVPANNTMEIDYINVSDTFVNESSYLDNDYNILETLPSNNRPTGYNGMTLFDTTLLKNITYYNGNWYDSSGNIV